MMALFGRLSVVPWILFAQSSWTMDAVPVITAGQPAATQAAGQLRDHGAVFTPGAQRRAVEALARIERRHRTPVLVETVPSLDWARIADLAQRRSRLAGPNWLYIFIARDEREVGVIRAQRGPASRLTDQQRETIRRTFLEPLQAGLPDEAIDRGVRVIGTTLDAAKPRTAIRDAFLSATLLLSTLAILAASQISARIRRRKTDAGTADCCEEGRRIQHQPVRRDRERPRVSLSKMLVIRALSRLSTVGAWAGASCPSSRSGECRSATRHAGIRSRPAGRRCEWTAIMT